MLGRRHERNGDGGRSSSAPGRSSGSSPAPTCSAAAPPRGRRATEEPDSPHRHGRPGGASRLPVLRRRLRAEGLRQGRAGRPDRGRPGQPDLARPALPEGLGQQPARHRPGPRHDGPATARPYAHRVGGPRPRLGDGHDRRPGRRRAREETWQERDEEGRRVARTIGIASLGGATLDNEENYLIKKLFTALGVVADREPGAYMTLRHGARSGHLVRPRRRHQLPAGPRQRGLHPHHGLEHGRGPPGRLPVGRWRPRRRARRSSTSTRASPAPARSRTSTCRIRAGTDIAFLGGLVNYVLSNELDFREYVLAYTNAATIISEEFEDTEDLDGLFSGFDPEHARRYDARSLAVRRRRGHRRRDETGAAQRAATPRPAPMQHEPHGVAGAAASRRATTTLQHPRCVFQILKRHFARYTPEMVARGLRLPARAVPRGGRGAVRRTPAASGRRRSSTPSAGRSTPSGVQIIRTAAILQLLLGNMGRPGGGIMAMRGHASIQGSTDIPTLYDLLPGYLPMPHADATTRTSEYLRRQRAATPAQGSGPTPTLHRQPAQGLVRRRGHAGERLLLRLPAADDGDHGTYRPSWT